MSTVLIIEDNTAINETTSELLELAGYTVITASGGMEGEDMAIRQKPDLVLCDIWMPEVDGYELLRLLKSKTETADIPIIFFSASTDSWEIKKAREQGADDFLCKPFTEEELLEIIERTLKKCSDHP